MLSINWSDVINVLASVAPHLIAIGIALIVGIVVTVAVNTRTVRATSVRKLVHGETWLAVLVAAVVAVTLMLYGPLFSLLNNATAERHTLQESTVAAANDLGPRIQDEAITMLKNDDGALPLSAGNINVFGWASTNPVYGGTGSGALSDTYPTVSLIDGLEQAGFTVNQDLTDLYASYRADRPEVSLFAQDWTLPEVPTAQYGDDLIADAVDFSDTAVIVLARVGGEGADLPTDMKAEGVTYTNNSEDYEDYQAGEHFLQLSQTERDMIDLVTSNFENVTLVYNGANTFQLDFLDDYPQITSVLWCPPAGQAGFTSLGAVLAGDVNPSGKTSDTFVRDLTATPSFNNFGDFEFDNMDEFQIPEDDPFAANAVPTFVNYVEGIYIGYKFYETAADEGLIDYDEAVLYPFGYGLSYTTFSQEMGDVTYDSDGTISFDVTVTNTGDVAGKDVVEVYYNPPYTNGGIEKASANLVAFDKTDELAPGESQTLTVEFADEDMASYDENDAEAYVLEQGDYVVSINTDSHTVIDERTVTVDETIVYDESNPRSDDQVAATNQFDDAAGDVTYLSRADGFANYAEATAAPSTYSLADEYKANFENNGSYDPADHNNADDVMPTTGADNGIRLADLYGADYDDERWDDLLDQLTFDEMDTLIALGGYGTQAIDSIGKIALTDLDGPASLNNNFTGVGSVGFPSSTSFACTWNQDLAREFGEIIGDMAHDMDASGWYAPSMNLHRSAFGGRNFEYYSEDPLLTGTMAATEVAGARSRGVYSFMKHFALNDQETNRWSMLTTWSNEQAIREAYLKPFEMSVKDGGAQAVMSAYNYIGVTYAAAYAPLQQTVLRDEWGFNGMVLSDYFAGFGFQNADQMIRNGNDIMLSTTDVTNHVTDRSATSMIAMRNAAHNILYTAVNSYHYENGEPERTIPIWQTITWVAVGALALLTVGLEVVSIRRFIRRRREEGAIPVPSDE
ncbi:beta-glucosidase [Bifidobacterium lemurum]|uniref:Beta-glucosidase n=1 Tax=Bifidobacterium lemurum TaxID=1603886 RepID=A0A261FVY2_9BIFI|nr:glycoside hydrolase family 3 N-terminal domain-containing protein [Bifidobacterium lemurum]OZG63331.1 beta-glucosidase [Bifidobacterium lemurum]QOL34246.1 glycoside hydrolase family 3 C-terminal domain-containing protein [Bifidobacterium lemurum]